MTPKYLNALARCLSGFNTVLEYQSITIQTSILKAAETLYPAGFKIVLNDDGKSIFLENQDSLRIRLVHHNVQPHHTWIVQTSAEFEDLTAKFASDPEFKHETTTHDHGDETHHFLHDSSGHRVRVACRKHPIFKTIVFVSPDA